MKTAHVYEYGERLYFRPCSQTTAGVWIGTDHVAQVDRTSSDVEKGQVALFVLEKSEEAIPHPTAWGNMDDDALLKAVGVPSWAAFMRGAKAVTLELADDVLRLVPERNLGPREGFEPIEDKAVQLAAGSPLELIGAGLEEVITRCE